jgi:hypothetical protein
MQLIMPKAALAIALAMRRAMTWWLGELASLLPTRWRHRERPHIEARLHGEALKIRIVRGRSLVQEGTITASGVEPSTLTPSLTAARRGFPVWLFPPADAVLSRTVQVPHSVIDRFGDLIATESDRWTSFQSDEIYLACRQNNQASASGKAAVTLYFVPRSALAASFEMLRSQELAPAVIVLDEREKISVRIEEPRTAADRRLQRHLLTAAALAAVAFIGADWLSCTHERAILHQRIAFERSQLNRQRELESKISNLMAISSGASNKTPAARNELFSAITKALPDTDWLSEIIVRPSNATLRGYTLHPETLIKAMEPLSLDRTVMLQGELSMDKRLGRNRFAIVLQLAQ